MLTKSECKKYMALSQKNQNIPVGPYIWILVFFSYPKDICGYGRNVGSLHKYMFDVSCVCDRAISAKIE